MSQKLTMEKTMRWFGPSDPVPLEHLKMAGISGVVTSLHHIPNGEIWSVNEISKRKKAIESQGLRWSVVESIPVHEDIKTKSGKYDEYIHNYCATLSNLAECGIQTVCYNFMALLDWTRTNLKYHYQDGSHALAFNLRDFAIFDIYLCDRPGALDEYSHFNPEELESYYKGLTSQDLQELENNILHGLPGSEHSYSLDAFKKEHERFSRISKEEYQENLVAFLKRIIPVAEKANVRLAIHPDDPPIPLLGLPKIVSTEDDLRAILKSVDSPSNGFTFCTGSYGVNPLNDLPGMIERLGDRLYFIHLRNVRREGDGNFVESDHLDGSVDMKAVVEKILQLMKNRGEMIPMRPDHGHQMLDDLTKEISPGYPAIGRLRGLAEIRGLEAGLLENSSS